MNAAFVAETLTIIRTVHDTVRDTIVRVAEPYRATGGFFGRLSPFEVLVAVIAGANAGYTIKQFAERAKVKLYLGEYADLVRGPGNVGRKLHLACNFVNTAVKMGVVHHLEATARGPERHVVAFKWHIFYEYAQGGMEVQKLADVYPLAIAGRDSLMRFIEFDVVGLGVGQRPGWLAGEYAIEVKGWVNRGRRRRGYNLRASTHLIISENEAKELREIEPVDTHVARFPVKEWMALGPHLERVVAGMSWPKPDEFPAHQGTADDVEQLLSWADGEEQFEEFLPRLRSQARQRDAAIAELRAARFLQQLGFEITAWEPVVGHRRVDLEVQWNSTPAILVEVKQPTWESELSEEERRSGRKDRPRVISGEGRWVDSLVEIRRAAEKAAQQIQPDRPNLLVIVDRLFRSPVETLEPGDLAGMLRDSKFTGVGGVLCIDTNWLKPDGHGVDYRALFEENPLARGASWALPVPAAAALAAVNRHNK